MSVIVDGSNGLIFNDASTQTTAATGFGFKNRVINGDMRIAQRTAGPATPTNGYNTVDRWSYWGSASSKFSQQQYTNNTETGYATRVAAGFQSYLGNSVTSAVSIGSGDYFFLQHCIEGYNFADFAFGTSNAKTLTLSFWVYSSLTGTFGGSFQNNAQDRSYPFSYTISSANTWTYITVTATGDISGTWLTNNSVGLIINFGLGMGSARSSTAGSWQAGGYFSSTGAVSVVGTNSATFHVTGVQLEKGSTATAFDYRDFGRELIMCMRYYTKFGGTSSGEALAVGMVNDAPTAAWFVVKYPITMRAAPTLAYSSIYVTNQANYNSSPTSIRGQTTGLDSASFGLNFGSGGTTFTPVAIITASAGGFISISAEL